MSAHTAPHYYNEIDPFAAQWLRNLIAAGHLPAGDVDERSIVDVKPSDLKGYTQCHFFAGIGGWPLALRMAGWSDDRPVWTGSCPCQPLSAAGQRKGHADERHLWPAFHSLITECKPPTVFGEQVASSDGREWFAGIRADLEDVGYACGGADLCAAGVGAPHIRQRLFWVADAERPERRPPAQSRGNDHEEIGGGSEGASWPGEFRSPGGLAHTVPTGRTEGRASAGNGQATSSGTHGRLAHTNGRIESDGRLQRSGQHGFWSQDAIAISCTDGKRRRVPAEPSFQPLAHGVPGRLGQLRAYGNAIVPQVGAAFITAFLEVQKEGRAEARPEISKPNCKPHHRPAQPKEITR